MEEKLLKVLKKEFQSTVAIKKRAELENPILEINITLFQMFKHNRNIDWHYTPHGLLWRNKEVGQ